MSYSKQNFRSGDTLYASQLNAMDDEIAVLEAEVESTKNMVGSPLTASTAAGMSDQTKIYVYTGNETGYTAGHWYYYNGTAWTDGGVYNSVAVNTDTSLTVSGQAADSKAVGDAIDDLDSDLSDVKSNLTQMPIVENSTETDVDLDVSDPNGNVVLRLEDGEIKTKNFDSSKVGDLDSLTTTTKSTLVAAVNELDSGKLDGNQGSANAGKIMGVASNGDLTPINMPTPSGGSGDVEVSTESTDQSADFYVSDQSGNGIIRLSDGHIQTKKFNSDNGVYENRFAYTNAAGTATITHFFPAGTKLAFHFTNYNDRARDGIKSDLITYKYTDTNNTSHTLGSDYGYHFPEYTLPSDAVSVSAQYGTGLSYGTDTTMSFKVYSMASFPREPHVVTVGSSGKDYTSIRSAVEYALQTADEMNRFEIRVYPGTYDIMSYYSAEEIAVEGFIGLVISNGISLVGMGHRSEVILTATLSPNDYNVTKRNYVSTLNIKGNTCIKNITIKAENIRYAVHDDMSMMSEQNNTHIFENVVFVGKNLTSSNDGDLSYGAGGGDLKKVIMRNCDFSDALTLHTSNDMHHEYSAYFENCRARLMQFGDYNSGVKTHVFLRNCNVSRIRFASSGSHDQYMRLEGEGTNNVMVESASGYVYALDGVHKFAGSNISAGKAVKLTSTMDGVVAATSLSEIYGVSIGVLDGATHVQTEGWLNSTTLGLSNLSVGDYLTIDNSGNVVSGGTSANAIAVVKFINSNSIAFAKLLI